MNNYPKRYDDLVVSINHYYKDLQKITNDELRLKLAEIEREIHSSKNITEAPDNYVVSVYAIVKETARRFSSGDIMVTANKNDLYLSKNYDFVIIEGQKAIYKNHWDVCGVPFEWNMVHYDEQLLGGILLHYGYATEMATGEGKTLVATLPVFLNALTHNGVHLMTVNDYLSKRDYETTRPIYMFHGLSADCIEYYERYDFRRKDAYRCDITFGTNSTFTFDYLWDHIAITPEDCMQQKHNYAIIDELDSILIDDADEPHLVGGGNHYSNEEIYKENFSIVANLVEQKDSMLYVADKLHKSADFTAKGKQWLSEKKDIPNLYAVQRTYEVDNFEKLPEESKQKILEMLNLQNVLLQILLSLTVYERDEDYIVIDEKVKIIDQHTGRVKESNRWEYGLHTAMEVKEKVKVQDDFDGFAVISLKNYFKLYNKIAGMSGTIMPVCEELEEVYGLKSAVVPTHKPVIRVDEPRRIFKTLQAKDEAILKKIIENQRCGRPSLVGSISVKRSESLCEILDDANLRYNKLDAKTIKDEATTVANAGLHNTITVSTSVAGRGTDIKPSLDALDNGGLMVIGTDLFESVRVDRQLKGRSGRQGNPGTSIFFASLEDYILKNLSNQDNKSLQAIATNIDGDEISNDVTRQFFIKAQNNREAYLKECRENVARKDDIIAPQRKKFYEERNSVLFDADLAKDIVADIITANNIPDDIIENHLKEIYAIAKQLIKKIYRNDPYNKFVLVPFTDNLHAFTVRLDAEITNISYEYFCKEFKRQIILQIYDKEWKKFVLYMLGNLDRHEIDMLDDRYTKMMHEIHTIILSRLCNAYIPFSKLTIDISSDSSIEESEPPVTIVAPRPILRNDLCPCGSGKNYYECHGSRFIYRKNIRRF